MIEIKIRFRSGEIGYFKPKDSQNIYEMFEFLENSIASGSRGIIELIDVVDDKRTCISIYEICTFGYSKVDNEK